MTESLSPKSSHASIAISSLIRAFHCPRQYYFQSHDELKPSDRYHICKQVSCADPDNSEAEIWNTIMLIYPDISPENRNYLSSFLSAMKKAPIRPWTDSDVTIRSDRAGLYGLLDKFHAPTGECTLTRCSKAPKTGCWPEDAIRTAALLMCIEESCIINPKGMYIEYIPSGIIRYYEPTPKDRRRVVQIIHQIKKIENGVLPSKPLNPPCLHCRFQEKCNKSEPKRLSLLFKK